MRNSWLWGIPITIESFNPFLLAGYASGKPENVIAFYSPIACMDSYSDTANYINKKKCISEWMHLRKVRLLLYSKWTNGRILGASVPSNWATKICRRTRSPPESTRTSIFIVKKAKLTPSRRAQSSVHRVGYVREWPKSWQDRDHNDRWDALLA